MELNFKKVGLVVAEALLCVSVLTVAYAQGDGEVVITPEKLDGQVGERVRIEEVFAQRVTLQGVTNIKSLELVTDEGTPIKEFPEKTYKAVLKDKSTKKQIGFVTLEPLNQKGGVDISTNQKGQYLFYQEGRVFNNLGNADEGKLYFWRKGKKVGSRPMILHIGDIENGTYTPKEYAKVTSKEVVLKKP